MKYWSKGIKSVLYGVIKRQTERRVVCRLRGELIRLKWVDNEWRWDLVTVILDIDLWRDKGGAEKDKMRASSLTDCSVHFMFKIWFNSGSLGSLIASIHSSLIHSSRTLWPLWIRLSVYPSLLSFITVRSGPSIFIKSFIYIHLGQGASDMSMSFRISFCHYIDVRVEEGLWLASISQTTNQSRNHCWSVLLQCYIAGAVFSLVFDSYFLVHVILISIWYGVACLSSFSIITMRVIMSLHHLRWMNLLS